VRQTETALAELMARDLAGEDLFAAACKPERPLGVFGWAGLLTPWIPG
jgi:hypothetical protein